MNLDNEKGEVKDMYSPMDTSRIDRQIEDLQRLKASYQGMPIPQPINNIIATQQQQAPIFEAKFTTENPSDILVQNKTAFIDLKNGRLTIKEIDGETKEFVIILPKDEKDLKIESLEYKLREMEMKINEYSKYNKSNNEKSESYGNDNEYNSRSKPKGNIFKSSDDK